MAILLLYLKLPMAMLLVMQGTYKNVHLVLLILQVYLMLIVLLELYTIIKLQMMLLKFLQVIHHVFINK